MQIRHDMISCFPIRLNAGGEYDFLQLRRRPGDYLGHTWHQVYGQIEANETAIEAAFRELKEETGLVPIEFYQLSPVDIFYLANQDTICHAVQFCAIVRQSDPVILNEEHDAFRWLPAGDAADHFLWPGPRRAVEDIYREILMDGMAKQYLRLPISSAR